MLLSRAKMTVISNMDANIHFYDRMLFAMQEETTWQAVLALLVPTEDYYQMWVLNLSKCQCIFVISVKELLVRFKFTSLCLLFKL